MSVAQVPWAERLSPAHLRRHGLEGAGKILTASDGSTPSSARYCLAAFQGIRGERRRSRFVIKKNLSGYFQLKTNIAYIFHAFHFRTGFFSCGQTKSQGSASRYIVCISSYPEQVEFSFVCMCQHFSFLHFLRRRD